MMKIFKIKDRGFSLLELILVITITSIVAMGAVAFYGNFQTSVQLNENTSYIIQTLRTARERSIGRLNNYSHGVDLQTDKYILYQNAVGSGDDRVNELDNSLSLSWNLSDSSNNISFSREFGLPSATGTITLRSSVSGEKRIIINDIGLVEEQ